MQNFKAKQRGKQSCKPNFQQINSRRRCFTSVHKPKALSGHQKDELFANPLKLPKCPEHPHNDAELLCTDPDCKIPTKIMCQTCVHSDQHKSHKHDFLMETLLKNEQTLRDVQKDLAVFQNKSEEVIKGVNLRLASYEVTGVAFKSVANSLSDQFDMKKREAICALTQFANEKKQEQTVLKRQLDKKWSEINGIKELIAEKLKMKNDLQNTDQIIDLKKRVDLINKSDSWDLPSGDCLNLNNYKFILIDMELQITRVRSKDAVVFI
ncbi:unnamed protein product [Caenorhabditis brenneri]